MRRFYSDGTPVLQTDLNGSEIFPPVWHKDIILEEVGRITQTAQISTKVDTNSLFAENTTAASLIFIANAYEDGMKVYDPTQGGWPTYMILYDLVQGFDDEIADNEGDNVMIGQRGDDDITGNGLLIGDGGSNTIPQNAFLPRIYQIYRALSSPEGSGFDVDEDTHDFDIDSVVSDRRNLQPLLNETEETASIGDAQTDDPDLLMGVLPPKGSDFGVVFDADFDVYPGQYRYVDYSSSLYDSYMKLSDVQLDAHLAKDLIGASTLSTDEGFYLQAMFRITAGFTSPTQHLHGNDQLTSGTGMNIVVGDDFHGISPFDLTQVKAVDEMQLDLDRLVHDLGKRLNTMEVDTRFFVDGTNVDEKSIKVASDVITTSPEGQAFVVGDFLKLYARSFLGATLSENQVLGMVDRSRDIELVLLDTHIALYELHENLLLRMEGMSDMKDVQVPQYTLTLAGDTITSEGEYDVLIGDSTLLFTQVDRVEGFEGSNSKSKKAIFEEGFIFEELPESKSRDEAVKDLMEDRDDLRDIHIEYHLMPSLNLSGKNAKKLPYADVPFYFIGCTDTINQESARNLAAGDHGFIGFVSSSQDAFQISDDYVKSVFDIYTRSKFESDPKILDFDIPFFDERYGSDVKEEVEPTLFGDIFSGESTQNAVLGEFLTAVGFGQVSAGPGGFLFDEEASAVSATYGKGSHKDFGADTFTVLEGTEVDGQNGEDIFVSGMDINAGSKKKKRKRRLTRKNRSRGNGARGLGKSKGSRQIDVEPFARALFYDHKLVAQWIKDVYREPVFYSTFTADGFKLPQGETDLFAGFIPPDIQGGIAKP